MILESELPEHLEIRKIDYGYGIFVKKNFKKGDLIYKTKFFTKSRASVDFEKKITLKVNSEIYELDPKMHYADFEGNILIYTWDSFLNHSCDPNTCDGDEYENFDEYSFYCKYALKDIEEGSQLTTNYLQFSDVEDQQFQCECKSKICFGRIKGRKYLTPEELAIVDSQYLIPRNGN